MPFKHYILSLAVAIIFAGGAAAQNTETDSLKRALDTSRINTSRVHILESLSYAYLSAYPDSALQYAVTGLQVAKEIDYPRGIAMCTNALGNIYCQTGDYPRALELYLQALQMKEQAKDQTNISVYYFNISTVYTEQKDYPNALTYLFKAKREDERAKDSSGIMFDLYSLGCIYQRMNKIDSALHYSNLAHQLALRQNDENMMGAILNSIGASYLTLKNTDLAYSYYHSSIPYAMAITDNEVLAEDYFGLAEIAKNRSQKDSSAYYGRKALEIATTNGFLKQVMDVSSFLADLYKERKIFDSAFHYKTINTDTKDSLFSADNIKKIQSLKFEEQLRQQAIATAKMEWRSKVKMYSIVGAAVVFLLIAFFFWQNNRQKQKAYMDLEAQQLKTMEAYKELKTTQAQLIQSEKMASLGELTAGIAHEIQNPLNFVNNFSEVNHELLREMIIEFENGNNEDAILIADDIKQNLEKVIHHGKRADAIVKGMLQHSRAGKAVKEATDINALADEYLKLSYHGTRSRDKLFHATIQTTFDSSIGKLNVVFQDIGRVLLNIYNNAFYAVSEKAKQNIPGYEPVVQIKTQKINNRIQITVADNGKGIPQNIIDKIFQPFFTTKPTGQGTGLGLSLSYDIIKAHGGDIRVHSKQNEGSEFIITLPVLNSKTEPAIRNEVLLTEKYRA